MRGLADLAERMAVRHDDGAMPAIAGQAHEAGEHRARAGGDGEIDAIGGREIRDLFGISLVQVQPHLRIFVAEALEHRRQHVTRLRVRGGDRQRAGVVLAQLRGQRLDAARLAHDLRGAVDHLGAGVGRPHQRAALAFEQLEAELVLELLELLADAGLRGVQHARRLGDVEVVLGDRDEVAELDQFHRVLDWWAIGGGEGEIVEGGLFLNSLTAPAARGKSTRAIGRVLLTNSSSAIRFASLGIDLVEHAAVAEVFLLRLGPAAEILDGHELELGEQLLRASRPLADCADGSSCAPRFPGLPACTGT